MRPPVLSSRLDAVPLTDCFPAHPAWHTPLTRLWRRQVLLAVLTEFWLSDGDEPLPDAAAQAGAPEHAADKWGAKDALAPLRCAPENPFSGFRGAPERAAAKWGAKHALPPLQRAPGNPRTGGKRGLPGSDSITVACLPCNVSGLAIQENAGCLSLTRQRAKAGRQGCAGSSAMRVRPFCGWHTRQRPASPAPGVVEPLRECWTAVLCMPMGVLPCACGHMQRLLAHMDVRWLAQGRYFLCYASRPGTELQSQASTSWWCWRAMRVRRRTRALRRYPF